MTRVFNPCLELLTDELREVRNIFPSTTSKELMTKRLSLAALVAIALTSLAPSPKPPIDEQTRQMLKDWKPRFDQAKLNHLTSGPFIIAGDCDRISLTAYCNNTVLAAQSALRRMYIDKDLDHPVLILLIETDGTYRRLSKDWLNEPNPSHFGFFQPRRHVMLMNVSTGTGTLVHELTHALVDPDFSNIPAWFNEGFASLFEQCTLNDGKITGLVNWRLPGLQSDIKANKLRPLRDMMNDNDFYAADRVGINYAQARYLMLYLQEKGLLQKYYRTFRDHADTDPTGVKTLESLVGAEKFNEFENQWRKWVMTLRFEG